MKRKILLFAIILSLFGTLAAEEVLVPKQETKIDNNQYYRSPLTLGFNYTSFSPLSNYEEGSPYSIYDLSASLRYTHTKWTVIQPEIIGGYTNANSQNSIESSTWDNSMTYGMGGIRLAHKFTKSFEIGLGGAFGYGQGVFPNLSDEGSVGTSYWLSQGSLHLGLSPTYNMSIELAPTIRYQQSTDSFFTDMNGFLLGVGGAVRFRFGRDPDSPAAAIKSIRFRDVEIDPLFAAMQSYYIKNSFGSIKLENTEKGEISDVVVSFFQPGYMDAPTIIHEMDYMEGGSSQLVDLKASFNNEIFMTEGITPLTGEIRVSYTYNRRPVEQSYPVSYDLYDKSSIVWDDDRKVAAFITPADSALQNYTSFIRQSCKEEELEQFNKNLQSAIQIFHALGEIGCIYQVDPMQPFASVAGEGSTTIDSVSLPRTTLKKLTGDCDDLTVMYLSLLETLGIETAFITVPGHIYTAFNTNTDARGFGKIHPDRTMTINIDGKLWVPVEITLIGRTNFIDAWKKGADEWNSLEETPDMRMLYRTNDARELFRPVGLREKDLGLQYGSSDFISQAFTRDMGTLTDTILADFYDRAETRGTKQDFNKLGIALAEFNNLTKARSAFSNAIKLDPDYISPLVNLGNLEFINENYGTAIDLLNQAYTILEKKEKASSSAAVIINLNLSKAYYAMEKFDDAGNYFELAKNIDSDKTAEYSYLAAVGSGSDTARASEVQEDRVIFMDEE